MKITKKETLYKGHYTLQAYTVQNGKEEFTREVFQTGQAAAAIVYNTQTQKFIFADQYRPAIEQNILEAVAGMLDSEEEKPEDALRREVEEEIGFSIDKLQPIAEFYPSPGSCIEKIHLFYAEVSQKTSEGGGKDEENEEIKAIEMTAAELKKYVFFDAKTLIGVQWVMANVLPTLAV